MILAKCRVLLYHSAESAYGAPTIVFWMSKALSRFLYVTMYLSIPFFVNNFTKIESCNLDRVALSVSSNIRDSLWKPLGPPLGFGRVVNISGLRENHSAKNDDLFFPTMCRGTRAHISYDERMHHFSTKNEWIHWSDPPFSKFFGDLHIWTAWYMRNICLLQPNDDEWTNANKPTNCSKRTRAH